MPEHKERPMIFTGEMVRAILRDRKTQTRRIVKWKMWPGMPVLSVEEYRAPFKGDPPNECSWTADHVEKGGVYVEQHVRCPHGLVGDRLWVRETWRLGSHYHDYTGKQIRETAEFGTNPMEQHVHYRAEESPHDDKWRSPYHMPRWASRLNLEIKQVRLERLHHISARGCLDEGVTITEGDGGLGTHAFRRTWDAINAKRGLSWGSNPWVWAITFKRI